MDELKPSGDAPESFVPKNSGLQQFLFNFFGVFGVVLTVGIMVYMFSIMRVTNQTPLVAVPISTPQSQADVRNALNENKEGSVPIIGSDTTTTAPPAAPTGPTVVNVDPSAPTDVSAETPVVPSTTADTTTVPADSPEGYPTSDYTPPEGTPDQPRPAIRMETQPDGTVAPVGDS